MSLVLKELLSDKSSNSGSLVKNFTQLIFKDLPDLANRWWGVCLDEIYGAYYVHVSCV